jgi:hypothetical protein
MGQEVLDLAPYMLIALLYNDGRLKRLITQYERIGLAWKNYSS